MSSTPPDDDDSNPRPDDGDENGADGDGSQKWYAVRALAPTRDATVDLLWPIDPGRWLRLALVALFVGGTTGIPTGGSNVGGSPSTGGGGTDVPPGMLPDVDPQTVLLVVGALLVALVVLGLLWGAVAGVMEFVLVEVLRSRRVRLRPPFRANVRSGLRLFGFRIVVALVALAVVGVPVALIVFLGFAVSPALFLLALPLVALVFLLALATWVVNGLTTDFVVPTMLAEDRGVLDGWRRVYPLVREEWTQVAVYLLLRVGLGIAAGLLVGVVALLGVLVLAVPYAVVMAVLYFAGGLGTATLVVMGAVTLVFALAALVVVLLAQVAPMTFLRYYSLLVLGELDDALDLVRPVESGDSESSTPE